MDFNLVRWVAFGFGFICIALCYRKNANHADLAVWIACSLWLASIADLAYQYGGHSVVH